MHWFWRVSIALFVGWVLRFVLNILLVLLFRSVGTAALQWFFLIGHTVELVAVLAVYGLLTRRYYRNSPVEPGIRCLGCGYNLIGNVSGVCPECGKQL